MALCLEGQLLSDAVVASLTDVTEGSGGGQSTGHATASLYSGEGATGLLSASFGTGGLTAGVVTAGLSGKCGDVYLVLSCPVDYISSAAGIGGWRNDLGWDNDVGWAN